MIFDNPLNYTTSLFWKENFNGQLYFRQWYNDSRFNGSCQLINRFCDSTGGGICYEQNATGVLLSSCWCEKRYSGYESVLNCSSTVEGVMWRDMPFFYIPSLLMLIFVVYLLMIQIIAIKWRQFNVSFGVTWVIIVWCLMRIVHQIFLMYIGSVTMGDGVIFDDEQFYFWTTDFIYGLSLGVFIECILLIIVNWLYIIIQSKDVSRENKYGVRVIMVSCTVASVTLGILLPTLSLIGRIFAVSILTIQELLIIVHLLFAITCCIISICLTKGLSLVGPLKRKIAFKNTTIALLSMTGIMAISSQIIRFFIPDTNTIQDIYTGIWFQFIFRVLELIATFQLILILDKYLSGFEYKLFFLHLCKEVTPSSQTGAVSKKTAAVETYFHSTESL